MGYSINQGGTCAVAAVHEVLEHRRPRHLLRLVVAAAAAALITVPLVWSTTSWAQLAGVIPVAPSVLVGAVMFGIGAVVNDACLLGSLGRLGEGELRFAILPAGLAAGFLLVDASGLGQYHEVGESLLNKPSRDGLLWLGAFAVILVAMLVLMRRGPRPPAGPADWSLGRATVVLGGSGGLLYTLAPAWSYADLIHRSLPLTIGFDAGTGSLVVAASVIGAVTSARRRRDWLPRVGGSSAVLRTLAGGCLMGIGAALIPGGNDGLILAAIPALSPGGAVAYLTLLATISAILLLVRLTGPTFRPWGSGGGETNR